MSIAKLLKTLIIMNKPNIESDYALKDNKLVFVDDVPNGIKCGCICPYCKAQMSAKNGGGLKIHHFAHYNSENCGHARESAYHIMTKEVIAKTKTILFPGESKPRPFVNVEVERRTDYSDLQPDCVVIDADGNRIWIEVKYTHEVTEEKVKRIIKNDIDCLEIDVSNYPLNPDEIGVLLKTDLESKKWINSPVFRKQKEEIAKYRKEHPKLNFILKSKCKNCINRQTERNYNKFKIVNDNKDILPDFIRKKLIYAIHKGKPIDNLLWNEYTKDLSIEDKSKLDKDKTNIMLIIKRFNDEFKKAPLSSNTKCKHLIKSFTHIDLKYVACKNFVDAKEYKKQNRIK